MTIIMSGTQRSKELTAIFTAKTKALADKYQVTPKLVVITVGEDPASIVYVGQKEKKAKAVGFDFEWITFGDDITQTQLLAKIDQLNQDKKVNGILVQLPLPKHLNDKEILEHISPDKDVDGFHTLNIGRLVANQAELIPCTPKGVMDLLEAYNIEIVGKNVVIIGRSLIVGLPMQLLMIHQHGTVTVCHSRTKNLEEFTKNADIIIAAVGQAEMIKAHHVKPGVVIVDVGINRLPNGKLVGDVAFDEVKELAYAITPVPGGVGPMTVAMLMEQTLRCACMQNGIDFEEL